MLSNFNHTGQVSPCVYGDEKPRWLTSAVGENGEEVFVVVNEIDTFDDVPDSAFSLRSEIKNGTLSPTPVLFSNFERLNARDKVEQQLNETFKIN